MSPKQANYVSFRPLTAAMLNASQGYQRSRPEHCKAVCIDPSTSHRDIKKYTHLPDPTSH